MSVRVVSVLLPAVSLTALPACMTTLKERRVKASIADLRARLEARHDTDDQIERAVADLTRALDDVRARSTCGDKGTREAATHVEDEIAALESRVGRLEGDLQLQAQARAAVGNRFKKRLMALEQSDAELAEKVGLSIPDDKEELWRQAMALLGSGHPGEGRRYCQAFIDRFPQDARASQAYLAIGRSYTDEALYSNAAAAYQQLLSRYPTAAVVPTAMWQLSRCFVELSFCSDARGLLRALVDRYPKSPEAGDAAKQLKSPKAFPAGAQCVG